MGRWSIAVFNFIIFESIFGEPKVNKKMAASGVQRRRQASEPTDEVRIF